MDEINLAKEHLGVVGITIRGSKDLGSKGSTWLITKISAVPGMLTYDYFLQRVDKSRPKVEEVIDIAHSLEGKEYVSNS